MVTVVGGGGCFFSLIVGRDGWREGLVATIYVFLYENRHFSTLVTIKWLLLVGVGGSAFPSRKRRNPPEMGGFPCSYLHRYAASMAVPAITGVCSLLMEGAGELRVEARREA